MDHSFIQPPILSTMKTVGHISVLKGSRLAGETPPPPTEPLWEKHQSRDVNEVPVERSG